MSSLRQFIGNAPFEGVHKQFEISVFNSNTTTIQNGGQCCCWVVPTGTTWAFFEVWSAGGDGAGACCCMGPLYGPGPGQYGRKFLNVTGGCFFTICAAGTGCRACQCCGTCGFPSWVQCGTGGAMAICAHGGLTGCTLCFRSYQGCTGICYMTCTLCLNVPGSDYCIGALNNPVKESNYCWNRMWSWATGAPGLANNTRHGYDYCITQLTRSGEDVFQPKWPGGSGHNARACGGGCCYGGFGYGGLVTIKYG